MLTKIISEGQIKRLHEASLTILKRVGVVVPHKEILERFAGSGAEVECTKQLVKIPEELVMRCLEQAGKQFTLYGRDLNRQACFGQGRRNYNSIAGEASWVDEIGGGSGYFRAHGHLRRGPSRLARHAGFAERGDPLRGKRPA